MNRLMTNLILGLIVVWSSSTFAEDIDLFASGLTTEAAADSLPNVLFVIDNTSNWSRQSQQWPNDTQGQSEVLAIKNTLSNLPADTDLNVGIIVYTTDGNANIDGAYIRFDMRSYQANKTALETELDQIYNNINDPDEKRNSNSSYGSLIYDVYNYLSGGSQTFAGVGTPTNLVDDAGYSTLYSEFDSPLEEGDLCSETYVIFVSNPDSNGPETDTETNSQALTALYADLGEAPPGALAGASSGGLSMPEYEEVNVNTGSSNDVSLGYSSQCYLGSSACSDGVVANSSETSEIQAACASSSDGCFCGSAGNQRTRDDGTGGSCPGKGASREYRYEVFSPASTGSSSYGTNGGAVDGVDYNLDDWTKFLHEYGVPVVVTSDDGTAETYRVPVSTYTIDVYNAQPNEEHSALMDSAAEQGGGYRQSATNAAELEAALTRIFGDIIDVNTSFAAVTLPLSATNRAQAENKVFVGMFRPASLRKPRWLGNLKHYQLAVFNGQVELADVDYNRAINPQTGFAQSCSTSFWTEDTTDVDSTTAGNQPYFDGLELDPNPVSECSATVRDGRSVLSDSPDGPFVEKGGAAQQIRNQVDGSNNSNRVLLTASSSAVIELGSSAFSNSAYYQYLIGEDPGLKGGDLLVSDGSGGYTSNADLADPEIMPASGLRATIHGDIVHSRPLTISYGPKSNATGSEFRIFYGANDGLFRALDPDTGDEDWAFIAPEHYTGIERLYRNTPTIAYFGLDASISTSIGALRKDYFFDGSAGSFTQYNASNQLSTGYIYPSMRRGGRMVYGFDISPTSSAGVPPAQPSLLFKVGCPNLDNDTGCSAGLSGIGQTWSTPVVGFVKGYSTSSPVLFMGGGWDDCLDVDSASLGSCTKGKAIYAIDAVSGTLLKTWTTDAPVVGEVTPLDIDSDGYFDLVYAADAAGAIYRVSLTAIASESASGTTSLGSGDWSMSKIASSSLSGVRFMNKPVVGELKNLVFVTLGSGDRERPLKVNYPYSDSVDNRFYVFIDRPYPYDEDGDGLVSGAEADISSRTVRNLDGSSMLNAATGLADGEVITDFAGWFLELPDRGEQVVNQSAIGGGYVFFNSFQPEGGNAGICANLGTSKAYRVPLFTPEDNGGEEFGQGIPIPPIIVTVDLNSNDPTCTGDGCGSGEIPDEVVTVCIGCKGFNPVEISPVTDASLREAFRVENMDQL